MNDRLPVDLDQLEEDEMRAELAAMTGDQLVTAVTDGIYDYPNEQSTQTGERRLGGLFVALQAADADGTLPHDVALAWDLVLAHVIDETLAFRRRKASR